MKLIRKNKNSKKGFTLIELIVVIAILAILALILIPSISGYVGRANTARDQANTRSLYTAAVLALENEDDKAATNIKTKAMELANIPTTEADKVTVTLSEDGKSLTSVTYNSVTFNGKDFE